MKNKIPVLGALAISVLFFSDCHSGNGKNEDDNVSANVTDLSSLFPGYSELDYNKQLQIIDSLRPQLTAMMQYVNGVSDIELSPELLTEWSYSPAVGYFTPAVDSLFKDRKLPENSLSTILSRAKTQQLDIPKMQYVTVVWGKTTPIIFNDTTMLIALNHYLGENYEAYESAPEYIRHYKTQENLPYDLCEAIVAHSYPFDNKDLETTMLNHLLYEGALVYTKTKLVGEKTDLAKAIGVQPEQLEWFDANEANMWKALAEQKLLYNTNPSDVQRLFSPSPSTNLIHPEAPGRAGRYIGYRIVKAYVDKHPKTLISDLLSPDFYMDRQSLVEAAYAPK